MAKSHKSVYAVWLLLFVGVAGILIANASEDDTFLFEIIPLTLTDDAPFVATMCEVKTSVTGLDKNGGAVITAQSTALNKHPTMPMDLTQPDTNKTLDSFKMEHKIKCNVDEDNLLDFQIDQFKEITVGTSSLETRIIAKDSSGNLVDVWNNTVNETRPINLTDNHQDIISSHSANIRDIHKYLEQGNYSTNLVFETTGSINLSYDHAPAIPVEVNINQNKIKTNITLDVTKAEIGISQPPKDPICHDCNDQPPDDDINEITDSFLELQLCISSLDMNCLMNQKFLPMYLGGFGFLFLLGALTTRRSPVFDSFGNRLR